MTPGMYVYFNCNMIYLLLYSYRPSLFGFFPFSFVLFYFFIRLIASNDFIS